MGEEEKGKRRWQRVLYTASKCKWECSAKLAAGLADATQTGKTDLNRREWIGLNHDLVSLRSSNETSNRGKTGIPRTTGQDVVENNSQQRRCLAINTIGFSHLVLAGLGRGQGRGGSRANHFAVPGGRTRIVRDRTSSFSLRRIRLVRSRGLLGGGITYAMRASRMPSDGVLSIGRSVNDGTHRVATVVAVAVHQMGGH